MYLRTHTCRTMELNSSITWQYRLQFVKYYCRSPRLVNRRSTYFHLKMRIHTQKHSNFLIILSLILTLCHNNHTSNSSRPQPNNFPAFTLLDIFYMCMYIYYTILFYRPNLKSCLHVPTFSLFKKCMFFLFFFHFMNYSEFIDYCFVVVYF